ncbi:MAG: cysteine hydrolase [Clostridia bacterium]|nr:cysteine hydrolase [Clostridia bacterium]
MKQILIVVDMQKDFIDGSLGTPEAVAILPKVAEKLRNFDGDVIFTRDTHEVNYMDTLEGKNLPVPHCIRDTDGWQIASELTAIRSGVTIDKPTFGSVELGAMLTASHAEAPIEKITLIGLCTDICVLSNALLAKAHLPEVEIAVDASCCAGVTPESHNTALAAMKMCQITIENE